MFRTLAAAALLVTSTALGSTGANAAAEKPETTPGQRVDALVSPSIVYIETSFTARVGDEYGDGAWINNGKPFVVASRCTGFVLTEDGYIGTAAHCITPKDTELNIDAARDLMNQAKASFKAEALEADVVFTDAEVDSIARRYFNFYPLTGDGSRDQAINRPIRTVKVFWGADVSGIKTDKARPAKVMSSQSFTTGDTALLKVNEENLNALPTYNGEDLVTGTNIAAVGFPAAIEDSGSVDADYTPSVKSGTVSAQKERSGGLTDVYEIDADVGQGMSGGPTVTQDGKVVGVNSFKPGGPSEGNFNFVQPIKNLKELTDSQGVDLKLGKTTQQYRKGLNAYFSGDKAVAVKNLQAVVDEQPANGLAKEYLDKAKELPNPPPPDEGVSTTVLLIGGALLLLALLGGLAFMLLRRRSGPSPMPQAATYAPMPGGEAGAPTEGGYPQRVTKVPTPRTPGEAGAPTGPAPVEPAEVRSSTPAGFARASSGAAGQTAPRPSTSQPGVSASPGITSMGETAALGEHHFCTQCGSRVPAGAKFCGECGHPV